MLLQLVSLRHCSAMVLLGYLKTLTTHGSISGPSSAALVVLRRHRLLRVLEQTPDGVSENLTHLMGSGEEELATLIHLVDLAVSERLMQLSLQTDRII
jgi:hypothetical protein